MVLIEPVVGELSLIGPKARGRVDIVGGEAKGFLFERCSAIDLAGNFIYYYSMKFYVRSF